MRSSRRLTLTGLVLVGALGLAGCGGAGSDSASSANGGGSGSASATASATPETPTAAALYPKMKAAATSATSAHMAGTTSSSSSRQIDFAGNSTGDNASLKVVTSDGTAEARVIGTNVFIKGDAKFWNTVGAGSQASKLVGKWAKAPASSSSSFKNSSLSALLKQAFKTDPSATELKRAKVELTDLDGVKAYKMTGFDSSDSALWIAAEGKPFPLRLKAEGTSSTGSASPSASASVSPSASASSSAANADLRFDQWNSVPKLTAPPASEIVSVPSLG